MLVDDHSVPFAGGKVTYWTNRETLLSLVQAGPQPVGLGSWRRGRHGHLPGLALKGEEGPDFPDRCG